MTSFQKELMTAIEEATMSTGLSADECIRQAIELLGWLNGQQAELELSRRNMNKKASEAISSVFEKNKKRKGGV